MNIHNFYEYINRDYLQQNIPHDQSSINSFTDVSRRNLSIMKKLLEESDSSSYSKLLQSIYHKSMHFIRNIDDNNASINCEIISNIIKEVQSLPTLMSKIDYLRQKGIKLFFTYGTMPDPNNTSKYIIYIKQRKLSFDKEYYHHIKYSDELHQLSIYRKKLLCAIHSKYNVYFNLDETRINNILSNISKMEQMLCPLMVSNVYKRIIKNRINHVKLNDIINKFTNIGFNEDCFLREYIDNKNENNSIIFSDDISLCKKSETVNFSKLSEEEKKTYDNGEYYWCFLDDLFLKYNTDSSIKIMIDDYIYFMIINSLTHFISYDIHQIAIKFYDEYLHGQKKETPIEERAIEYLISTVPELVGDLYCMHLFPETHKHYMNNLIMCILHTMKVYFTDVCEWIKDDNNATINKAINKINKICQKIGYPEKQSWILSYQILFNLLNDNIDKITLLEFNFIITKWNEILTVQQFNKPYDKQAWNICAMTTNAYYNPLQNDMVFPAGILQPPFFFYLSNDDKVPITDNMYINDRVRIANDNIKYNSLKYLTIASNFGAIGVVIGHEISHGFDDQGSQFDENGTYCKWMSNAVLSKYKQVTEQIINQYNQYGITLVNTNKQTMHKYYVNGKLTLGENMADHFGMTIALMAYKQYHKDHLHDHLNNKTLDEGLLEFFVAFGNMWRSKELTKKIKNKVMTDVHALSYYRVFGTLSVISDYNKIMKIYD